MIIIKSRNTEQIITVGDEHGDISLLAILRCCQQSQGYFPILRGHGALSLETLLENPLKIIICETKNTEPKINQDNNKETLNKDMRSKLFNYTYLGKKTFNVYEK